MKKITLLMGLVAMQAVALQTSTPTKFTPTPMNEEVPLRFLVSLDNANMFSGGGPMTTGAGLNADGKVGLMNIQLNLALMYSVGMGLDVGFGLHGGIQSPYSMFITPSPALVDPLKQYSYMFGADVMVRYLSMWTDMLYAGLQAQVGYNYTDSMPGATDATYNASFDSKTAANSFIPVVAGLPMGVVFADAAVIYLFPAIELGQTGNYTNTTAPAAADQNKGIWKSAVGMQVAAGTVIYTGVGDLVLQLTPRYANFSNKYSWGLDVTTGMQWDF